jgi:signal transduction histidine kinase
LQRLGIILGSVTGFVIVTFLLGVYDGAESALWTSGMQSMLLPGILAGVIIAKIKSEDPKTRKILVWLGVFAAGSVVAEAYSFLDEVYFGIDAFPSIADGFWIAGYGGLFVFFWKNFRQFQKIINKNIALLSVGISAIFLIPAILVAFQLGAEENLLGLATTLSYPISDAIIMIPLSLGLMIFIKGIRNNSWVFLFIATSAFMVGDFIYPYYELDETYYTGHPIDITWILGYLFFTFAAITFDGKKLNAVSNITQNAEFFKFENIHRITVPLMLGAIFAVTLTTIYQMEVLTGGNTEEHPETYWLISIMIAFTGIILAINHNLSKIVKTRTAELTKQTQKLEHEIREKNTLIMLQKRLEKEVAEHNKELVQKSHQLQEQNKILTEQGEELESQRQQLKEQNEKLLEVDKQKAEFASMVTHELKTPLTPIMSWCEVLLDHSVLGQLNEGQKNAVHKIRHNATKELALISDILDAEKLGLNQMKFNFKDLEVLPFAKELSENYAPVFAEKQILYTVTCPKYITIHVDESRLAQVIKNFVNNSMDFIPKQGGKISLHITHEEDFAIFSVIDNGVGIPKEKQQHLFKKFYQIDTSPTRKHGGSGLGLAICKGIIESFGGTIGVQSESGVGSAFYFKIPLKSQASAAA